MKLNASGAIRCRPLFLFLILSLTAAVGARAQCPGGTVVVDLENGQLLTGAPPSPITVVSLATSTNPHCPGWHSALPRRARSVAEPPRLRRVFGAPPARSRSSLQRGGDHGRMGQADRLDRAHRRRTHHRPVRRRRRHHPLPPPPPPAATGGAPGPPATAPGSGSTSSSSGSPATTRRAATTTSWCRRTSI